jgi:hypothetical protein
MMKKNDTFCLGEHGIGMKIARLRKFKKTTKMILFEVAIGIIIALAFFQCLSHVIFLGCLYLIPFFMELGHFRCALKK